jgi:hypothetical protein
MSRAFQRTIAVSAAVLIVAWGAYRFWPSEERRVRGRLEALEETVNERPTDGIGLVTRTAQLTTFFENDVVLDPGRGAGAIRGRERLIALASRVPNSGNAFAVRFVDVSVSVDGADAIVRMTATITSIDARGEENVDAREVELALRKSDDWRIARITAVEVLERPQP